MPKSNRYVISFMLIPFASAFLIIGIGTFMFDVGFPLLIRILLGSISFGIGLKLSLDYLGDIPLSTKYDFWHCDVCKFSIFEERGRYISNISRVPCTKGLDDLEGCNEFRWDNILS